VRLLFGSAITEDAHGHVINAELVKAYVKNVVIVAMHLKIVCPWSNVMSMDYMSLVIE
tara:strand:- start:5441 stop:5614 length:174 start_codon:yes stop_codon:yes gene_type:complete